MATAWLEGHLEVSKRTFWLASGDLAMIGLFVAIGELRHGGSVGAGVATFAQFAVAWVVVGTAAGVYGSDALAGRDRAVIQGLIAWIVAAVVGQLIRLLVTPGTIVQPTFVLVSIGFGGLLMGGWRFVAAGRFG